jgi:hypothetical protein
MQSRNELEADLRHSSITVIANNQNYNNILPVVSYNKFWILLLNLLTDLNMNYLFRIRKRSLMILVFWGCGGMLFAWKEIIRAVLVKKRTVPCLPDDFLSLLLSGGNITRHGRMESLLYIL